MKFSQQQHYKRECKYSINVSLIEAERWVWEIVKWKGTLGKELALKHLMPENE